VAIGPKNWIKKESGGMYIGDPVLELCFTDFSHKKHKILGGEKENSLSEASRSGIASRKKKKPTLDR
jgi:hypothetical protein